MKPEAPEPAVPTDAPSRGTAWLFAAWLPPVLVVLVAMAGISLFEGFNDPAMPTRLAPAFAVAHGHPLYAMPGDGPVLLIEGGPVASLSYIPVTLFHSANGALWAGQMLNLFFYLAPFCVIAVWLVLREGTPPLHVIYAVIALAFLGLSRRISLGPAAWLQPHAPVLFWSGLALAAKLLAGVKRGRLFDGVSAFLAALAFWSDPALAAVIPALLLAAALTGGRDALIRRTGAVLGFVVALGLILAFACGGPRAFHFHLVTLPLATPWAVPFTMRGFLATLMDQAAFAQVPLLLAIPVFVAQLRSESAGPPSPRLWLPDHPTALLLLHSLLLMPLAGLVAMKRGDPDEAFALPVWFLVAYVLAALPGLFRRLPSGRSRLQLASLGMVLLLAYADAPLAPLILRLDRHWANASQSDLVRECGYLEDHGGRVWFPASPLAHLIMEHRPYHSSAGLRRLDAGGHALDAAAVAKDIPEEVQMILAPLGEDLGGPVRLLPPGFESFTHPAFRNMRAWRRSPDGG